MSDGVGEWRLNWLMSEQGGSDWNSPWSSSRPECQGEFGNRRQVCLSIAGVCLQRAHMKKKKKVVQ